MKCDGCHGEFWSKRSLASHKGYSMRFGRIINAYHPTVYANWFLEHISGKETHWALIELILDIERPINNIYNLIDGKSNETSTLSFM